MCDDFERDDVQGSWNSASTDNGGTAAIRATTFTSTTRTSGSIVTVDGDEVIRATLQNAYAMSALGVLLDAY